MSKAASVAQRKARLGPVQKVAAGRTRIEKLERGMRAAMRLRRTMEDLAPHFLALSVPRAEVERFDKVIEELKQ